MSNTIEHTVFLPHPPSAVWEYLTRPELITQWLMESDFQPEVGHSFQFRMKPMPALDTDGIFKCKVLELVPHQRLSYSWQGSPGDGSINLDTVVAFSLAEKDGGTELSLKHSGFTEENSGINAGMDAGWLGNMRKIGDLIKNSTHADARG